MKQRCYNDKHPLYRLYGARGIVVCDRWLGSFAAFADDMGPKPTKAHSIDREDNNGPYDPANCRWATRSQQSRNQRQTRFVTIEGVRHLAADLAARSGVKTDTIVTRARRWLPLAKVLSPAPLERDPEELQANWKRAIAISAAKKREATHCKRGHEFTATNTQITGVGRRRCRACTRLRDVNYRTNERQG